MVDKSEEREKALTRLFKEKRLKVVPKVSYCIAFETMFMFFYITETTLCIPHWSSHRQHAMAWVLFLLYVFVWAKQAYSFFMTFGTIVRDTCIGMSTTLEESFTMGAVAVVLLVAAILNYT